MNDEVKQVIERVREISTCVLENKPLYPIYTDLITESLRLILEIERQAQEIERLEAVNNDLLDDLEDYIHQECFEAGYLDSQALSSHAHGLRTLAKHGRVIIDSEVGKRIIAHYSQETDG